jgi:hypothetical protein
MPRGNPNPSPETRYGGPRGNVGRKTTEQREAEIRNAWIATDIRTKVLDRLNARLADPAQIDAVLDKMNINSLLKDTEDRGLGAAKASVDVTTNGKDMPGRIDLNQLSPEALAELVALNDAARRD